MVNFWPKVKSNIFHVKPLRLVFGQLLEKIGQLFNSASGHSGQKTYQSKNGKNCSKSLTDFLFDRKRTRKKIAKVFSCFFSLFSLHFVKTLKRTKVAAEVVVVSKSIVTQTKAGGGKVLKEELFKKYQKIVQEITFIHRDDRSLFF